MKNLVLTTAVSAAICFVIACGGSDTSSQPPADSTPAPGYEYATDPVSSDPKGKGKFTNVELTNPLDQKMVAHGKEVFDVKCGSCHKLTDEKLVGPGWKGVTTRRTPEWFMNFITNTDEMLNQDAEALSMLEICLVRMPNQNLTDDEARAVLEFARSNDGVK
jgi:cytochrome c551/c552